MENIVLNGMVMLVFAFLAGLAAKKLTGSKLVAQGVITLVGAGMFMMIVIPAFLEETTAIAMRPLERERQRQEAIKHAEEVKIMKEKELMQGVREQMKMQEAKERAIRQAKAEEHLSQYRNRADPDQAFERWYRPLEACQVIKEVNMMMCANHRIRERVRFDKLYEAGKIN